MLTTATTVTVVPADFEVSAWEIAVTVTAAGLGTAAGAVYKPAAEMVPTVALPPVIPLTCQVTAVLAVFRTVALNCCDVATVTLIGGEIEMTTGLLATATIVAVVPADFVLSA